MERVIRAKLEEEGFEALQRLYAVACRDTGQARKVACFLLGLYNGDRFPFDLTDLRGLDDDLFSDCMLVLRMDARVCRQEVHNYFDAGGRKFERLATDWGLVDHRLMRLKLAGEQSPDTPTTNVPAGDYNARLVTYTHTPGYRKLGITVDLRSLGAPDRDLPLRADLSFDKSSSMEIMEELMEATRVAWKDDGRIATPLDASDGERPPRWVVDGY